jgi:hypothetical protein
VLPRLQTIDPSVAAPSATCRGSFTATVYRGLDTGLSVQGELTLQADASGSVTGVLKQTNGPQVVSIVGQANGRAINLLFDLGKKQLLFGVGTMQNDLRACEGQAGGSLVGPREADSGDWGVIWGT